ncbi:MAG: thiamine-phosphate kinase [Gemmatimonadetes bacterium]|nr:thiamine-phosphate kinase [Gemmatimonadota bacterium]
MSGPGSGGARTVRLGPGAEFDLIRRILGRSEPPALGAVRVGPGDDCAVVQGDGIAISCDLSVEDVHFRRAWLEPEEIGYRAAAAALSDLAAVAAAPIGILAAMAIPARDGEAVGLQVAEGITAAARDVGAALLGGDVSRSPGPLVIDVIAVGEAPNPILRSGARPQDELWVTGELGCSAAVVRQLQVQGTPGAEARQRFARPRPRTTEARWLAAHVELHAMIDLSDGLAGDAGHIAAASGVAVVLDLEGIPIHAAAREVAATHEDALRLALAGGEDYELCFAAPAGAVEPVREAFRERFGIALTRAGRVTEGEGVWVEDPVGGRPRPTPFRGFDHFRGGVSA